MIAFLTQYYRGLGHSQRIKFIAEKVDEEVVILDQLFQPPLTYDVPHEAFLKDYKLSDVTNMFQFIMNENMINYRIKRFIECLERYQVTTLVCEGFPFCRHQFAHEYLSYFEECKKRDIKIIISIRDFPWDEPHDPQLTDWVNHTQNIIINYYVDKVLVHGDPKILPLLSDRTNHSNSVAIYNAIKDKIIYTGYVCDSSLKKHEKKNNLIYVSTGLNKEEGVLLFKYISKIAKNFRDYHFIMPIANRYKDLKSGTKGNLSLVEYIPNLRYKISDCAAYITYGGYNATTEILKTETPSIIIPRQDGQKMEQFVRAYVFEKYGFYNVLNMQEIDQLSDKLINTLNNKPVAFNFRLDGAKESAHVIRQIHNG